MSQSTVSCIATIWFIYSAYMLGGHILSALWAGLTTYVRTPNGFYWSSLLLFFLFASHFSHSSTLFYFKTDESSERHLKLSCLFSSFFFFFDPRPVLFYVSALISAHMCAASHTHTRTSLLPWIRDLSKSLHTPSKTDCSTRGGGGGWGFWSVLMIYTVHLHTKK